MRNSDDDTIRLRAAEALLDRGHGKPTAIDEGAVIAAELERMSVEALNALKNAPLLTAGDPHDKEPTDDADTDGGTTGA